MGRDGQKKKIGKANKKRKKKKKSKRWGSERSRGKGGVPGACGASKTRNASQERLTTLSITQLQRSHFYTVTLWQKDDNENICFKAIIQVNLCWPAPLRTVWFC